MARHCVDCDNPSSRNLHRDERTWFVELKRKKKDKKNKMKNWIHKYGGWVAIAAIIITLGSIVSCTQQRAKEISQEMGSEVMPNGNRIFEIERDGVTYIVVQCHQGVGICKK